MAKPITIPNTFQTQIGPIPLSQLDSDFTTVAGAINDYQTYTNGVTDTGVTNALVVTILSPATFAYALFVTLDVQVSNTTTSTAPTINVNSLGAKTITRNDGGALASGALVSGGIYRLIYDGTNFRVSGGSVSGLANPTANVGLTAVNGSATTAMRSDAAPALSQAIAPTWTGFHIFNANSAGGASAFQNAGTAGFLFVNTGAPADQGQWRCYSNTSGVLNIQAINDAHSGVTNLISSTRSGATITALTFGNPTDNPAFTFSGTGASTFNSSTVTFSASSPFQIFNATSAGLDGKNVILRQGIGGTFQISSATDAAPATPVTNALAIARTAAAWSGLTFGNATDNPTYTFAGTGAVTVNGNATFQSTTGNQVTITAGAAGQPLQVNTQATSGQGIVINSPTSTVTGNAAVVIYESAGLSRWQVGKNQNIETGSNAGSDYGVFSYSDAGSFLGNPLGIQRSSGAVTISAPYVSSAVALNVIGASAATALVVTPAVGSTAIAVPAASTGIANIALRGNGNSGTAAFSVQQDASSNANLNNLANANLTLATNGTTRLTVGAAGAMTIAQPTTGVALTMTGTSAATSLVINQGASGLLGWQVNDPGANLTNIFCRTDNGEGSIRVNGASGTNTLTFYTAGSQRVIVGNGGNLTINAPSSGTALAISAVAGGNGVTVTAPAANTANVIVFGNNNTAGSGGVFSQDGSSNVHLANQGNAAVDIDTNGSNRVAITGSGNVTISAPASGVGLTVNGLANAYTELVQSSTTASQGFGLNVQAGTNASDKSVHVSNAGNTTTLFDIFGDGGVVVGAPTGGDKGLGTVNATGLFVNGAAVGGGTVTGTFTGTLTGMTSATTGTVNYAVNGNIATLWIGSSITGTSNTTAMTMTGLPGAVTPVGSYHVTCTSVMNNTVSSNLCDVQVSGSVLTFSLFTTVTFVVASASFTNSGSKGLTVGWTVSYPIS